MKNSSDMIVVGAGAAGMTAAIAAAREGVSVTVLEHMDTAGKKILVTGNGKCNYTNKRQGVEYYYGDNPAFVLPVLSQFGFAETIAFFEELGILPRDEHGYYYPASRQASSVREVLLMELARLGVKMVFHCGIRAITKTGSGFRFETKEGNFYSAVCLLASGGCSAKKTGSDGSGFLYLDHFGHHIIDVVPALVGLKGRQSFFGEIAGIRAEIRLELYIENEKIATEEGELQLTTYGISGIPVFQVSRIAARALSRGKCVCARIDFAPSMNDQEKLDHLVRSFAHVHKTAAQALTGSYPSKLIPVFLRLSGIDPGMPAGGISLTSIQTLAKVISSFRVDIDGTNQFDSAQTTAGGVDTSEIDNNTLESKLVPGLYFAGEMIDIDGKCGGYNLQWAWSSGYVAGKHGAAKIKETV